MSDTATAAPADQGPVPAVTNFRFVVTAEQRVTLAVEKDGATVPIVVMSRERAAQLRDMITEALAA